MRAFVVSIFILLSCCFSLSAEDYDYSVVLLKNETPFRIYYSYRWGDDGQVYRNSIPPHSGWGHWWEMPGEDWAPWLYIQRDGDDKWYKLGSFYTHEPDPNQGRKYYWTHRVDERGINVIEFYEHLYTH